LTEERLTPKERAAEGTGGLGVGCPSLECFDYLLAQVFRVGFHPFMIAQGSTVLILAVRVL
jgi:hypothetical protein